MTEPSEPEDVRELNYDEALTLALRCQRDEQFGPAEQILRALCELQPQDPNPAHFLGVLLARTGRQNDALPLIERSIELDPMVADWHNNLGNALLQAGRVDEAARSYAQCSALAPDNLDVLNNLGVMQRQLGQFEQAEATLMRAIELDPGFSNARHNLAALCIAVGRFNDGIAHSVEALSREPKHPATRRLLSLLYSRLGRDEEAVAICQEWLELEPDSPHARHYLAACSGKDVPDRASSAYVEQVFDSFASSFDSKLAALDYRAPELVGRAVADILGPPGKNMSVLDAGCGTGLCASWLAPYASRLEGVDLSQAMLAKAKERELYDSLVKDELVHHLRRQAAHFDLIVSADTLCYFGALDEALSASALALTPGGWIVFTVESHEDDTRPFWLHAHGRYSHALPYVAASMKAAGLSESSVSPVVLRHEFVEPVHGWLIQARRALN